MKSKERIDAVVALEAPDRVPVGPFLDMFGATYAGITKQEFIEDGNKRIQAVIKTAKEMGPWDISFMGENTSKALLLGAPTRVKWPGKDLDANDIHQFEEFEFMQPEDYDLMAKIGVTRFMANIAFRLYPELTMLEGIKVGGR